MTNETWGSKLTENVTSESSGASPVSVKNSNVSARASKVALQFFSYSRSLRLYNNL